MEKGKGHRGVREGRREKSKGEGVREGRREKSKEEERSKVERASEGGEK